MAAFFYLTSSYKTVNVMSQDSMNDVTYFLIFFLDYSYIKIPSA